MDIQAEKLNIIQQLLSVEDELLLEAIQKLLDYNQQKRAIGPEQIKDFWDELTDAQKSQIALSRKQLRKGKGIPHNEIMDAFRKKYNA